jgi:hypothetical protein
MLTSSVSTIQNPPIPAGQTPGQKIGIIVPQKPIFDNRPQSARSWWKTIVMICVLTHDNFGGTMLKDI